MNSRESGQALPLGIALLLAGALMGIVLFNTGEVVDEKTRLANAADAAVYSGITWQARALNFNAYTNRAMVANQVAMAQAVSLQSWAEYARTSTGNLSAVLGSVPVVGQIAHVVNQVMSTIEPLVSGLGTGILAVVDPINSALSTAQEAMFMSAFVASPQIVNSVAEANDPRIKTDSAFSLGYMGNNLHEWSNFTDQFEPTDDDAMDERVAMINASTDPFTNDRSWNFFKSYLPVGLLVWLRAERSGATRLLRDEETGDTEWKAIDTLSLNSKLYYWFRRYKRVEAPIGYALKYANDQEESIEKCNSSRTGLCNDWFGRNQRGQRWARNVNFDLSGTTYEPKTTTTYKGVRAYRSLSNEIRKENAPRLLMRTELQLDTSDINDAKSIGVAPSTIASVNQSNESMLSSLSSAEVFFNRPEDDAREEYASGYNPFWTVRLAPTTNEARVAAMTLRGSAPNVMAVGANLAVYEGNESIELPQNIGSGADLLAWSPNSVGTTASDIQGSGDLMEEVLTDVLDDVLSRILQSVLSGGIQTAVNVGEQALGGVDIDEIITTVDEVNEEIEELTARYEAARESISQEFSTRAESLRAELDSRLLEINQLIDALEEEQSRGAGTDRDEEIHREIQALIAERDGTGNHIGLDEEFRENLAAELVEMVSQELPDWPISSRDALYVVDEYLNSGADVSNLFNAIDFEDDENE